MGSIERTRARERTGNGGSDMPVWLARRRRASFVSLRTMQGPFVALKKTGTWPYFADLQIVDKASNVEWFPEY